MPILGERIRFTRRNVEQTPDVPGVYALYVNDEIAFYGHADGGATIRSCLTDHLWGRQTPSRSAARQFSYEVTRFPLSRECALLEEHRRKKWELPAFNQNVNSRRPRRHADRPMAAAPSTFGRDDLVPQPYHGA